MNSIDFYKKVVSNLPKTVSIIGLAKNVGKTTTLNRVLRYAGEQGIKIGLASSGWDGERHDSVTGKAKPSITPPVGTIIVTTDSCLQRATGARRILKETDLITPLGKVVIVESLERGQYEISGPSTLSELIRIKKELLSLGCELLLFDGAINRKASGSNSCADQLLVATGLNAGYSIREVRQLTSYFLSFWKLPKMELELELEKGENCYFLTPSGEIAKTISRYEIDSAQRAETDTLYIKGAFTDSLAEKLIPIEGLERIAIEDPISIFVTPYNMGRLKKRFQLYVRAAAPIIAVTLNPTSSSGHSMVPEAFLESMKQSCEGFQLLDLILEEK